MTLVAAEKTDLFKGKILVAEDDPNLREALCDTLQIAQYQVLSAENGEQALARLADHSDITMVVSDVNMGKVSGHDVLRASKQKYPYIPVLLITAYASISQSVEAMKEGAVDYLVKPFKPQVLLDTVARYVGFGLGLDTSEPIAEAVSSKQLLQLARRVASADSTVLIVGESGTGKEILARFVHNHSPRQQKPFIAINCAAIPENMLEAMLFGHEKGAYTGAHSSAPGKFEQANGGTLLLDEISEMDLGLQAKLLRVLQEREVERLGGRKTIQLDVRIIATSNRDLGREVGEGKFREDLYYRLNVLPLQWAPLRARIDDILPLANQLLSRHASKQHRADIILGDDAVAALRTYSWPGNVRELDNVMQRALILQPGNIIRAWDLGLANEFTSAVEAPVPQTVSGCYPAQVHHDNRVNGEQDLRCEADTTGSVNTGDVNNDVNSANGQILPYSQCPALQSSHPMEEPGILGDDLKLREFEIIVNALQQEGGSKKNTAVRLGISPRTLRYKLARFRELGMTVENTSRI